MVLCAEMHRMPRKESERLTLLGLEHPLVRSLMDMHTRLDAGHRALAAKLPQHPDARGVLTVWRVEVHGGKGQFHRRVVMLGLNENGERSRTIERVADHLRDLKPSHATLLPPERRLELVRSALPEMLRRDSAYAGALPEGASFSAHLLAWVELA